MTKSPTKKTLALRISAALWAAVFIAYEANAQSDDPEYAFPPSPMHRNQVNTPVLDQSEGPTGQYGMPQDAPVRDENWLEAALSSGAEITDLYGHDVSLYCVEDMVSCGPQPRTSLRLAQPVPSSLLISDRFDGYFSRQVSLGAAVDLTDTINLYGEATFRDTGEVLQSGDAMPDALTVGDGAVLFGWGARVEF